jgi:uncharacterized membrane protein YhfC
MAISLGLIVLFPVVLAIVLYRRYRFSWLAVLVGAVVFLVFQVLTRIPLLGVLGQMPWYQQFAANNFFLFILALSFTAGLFEEVGRWLGFRFPLKGRWRTINGVAYGIGHGGFEAIILTGLAYVNNLVISLMINTGQFETLIAPQMGALAETVRAGLVDTPSFHFLIGGLERVFAMVFHIGLSLVVMNAVRLRRPLFLLYAILLHTATNLAAVLISRLQNGIWLSEGFMLLVAVAAFLFIRSEVRKGEPVASAPGAAVPGPVVEDA